MAADGTELLRPGHGVGAGGGTKVRWPLEKVDGESESSEEE